MKNLIKLHQFVDNDCDLKAILIDADMIDMINEKEVGTSISLTNSKHDIKVKESPSEINRLINKINIIGDDKENNASGDGNGGMSRADIREMIEEEIHDNMSWVKRIIDAKIEENMKDVHKAIRNDMKEQKWNDWWDSLDGHD